MTAADGRSVLPAVYQIQRLCSSSQQNARPSSRALALQRSLSDTAGQSPRAAASPRQNKRQTPSASARFISIFIHKKPKEERGAAADDPAEEKGEREEEDEDEEEGDTEVEHSDVAGDESDAGVGRLSSFERNEAFRSAFAKKAWGKVRKVATTIKAVKKFTHAAEVAHELKESGLDDPEIWVNTTFVDHEAHNPGEGHRGATRGGSSVTRLMTLPDVAFTHRCRIHLFGVTNIHEHASLLSRDPYVRMTLILPDDRSKVLESNKVKDTTDPVWDPPVSFGAAAIT